MSGVANLLLFFDDLIRPVPMSLLPQRWSTLVEYWRKSRFPSGHCTWTMDALRRLATAAAQGDPVQEPIPLIIALQHLDEDRVDGALRERLSQLAWTLTESRRDGADAIPIFWEISLANRISDWRNHPSRSKANQRLKHLIPAMLAWTEAPGPGFRARTVSAQLPLMACFDRDLVSAKLIRERLELLRGQDGYAARCVRGFAEKELAWVERGGGYANTVSAAGWKGFADHLATARKDLTAAWLERPDLPMAPRLMIGVAMGDHGDDPSLWCQRALEAWPEDARAIEMLAWANVPRWGGTLEKLLAIADLATKDARNDSPLLAAAENVLEHLQTDITPETYAKNPRVWQMVSRLLERVASQPKVLMDVVRMRRLAWAVACGQTDEAVRLYLEGGGPELTGLDPRAAPRTGLNAAYNLTFCERLRNHWKPWIFRPMPPRSEIPDPALNKPWSLTSLWPVWWDDQPVSRRPELAEVRQVLPRLVQFVGYDWPQTDRDLIARAQTTVPDDPLIGLLHALTLPRADRPALLRKALKNAGRAPVSLRWYIGWFIEDARLNQGSVGITTAQEQAPTNRSVLVDLLAELISSAGTDEKLLTAVAHEVQGSPRSPVMLVIKDELLHQGNRTDLDPALACVLRGQGWLIAANESAKDPAQDRKAMSLALKAWSAARGGWAADQNRAEPLPLLMRASRLLKLPDGDIGSWYHEAVRLAPEWPDTVHARFFELDSHEKIVSACTEILDGMDPRSLGPLQALVEIMTITDCWHRHLTANDSAGAWWSRIRMVTDAALADPNRFQWHDVCLHWRIAMATVAKDYPAAVANRRRLADRFNPSRLPQFRDCKRGTIIDLLGKNGWEGASTDRRHLKQPKESTNESANTPMPFKVDPSALTDF